jgi:S1-C subfamily serine protease
MKHTFWIALCAGLLTWPLAWAQPDQALPTPTVQRIMQSVVSVQTRSDEQASTARTLGQQRLGSGVVIAPNTVLTIGYLLLEATTVDLIDHQGRTIPGQVRAVDTASGLGLIRALVPLRLEAVPLGDSDALPTPGKLWTLGQRESELTALELVSRRPFAAVWEYWLEAPLMTLPAVNNWSGAGLFDQRGQLVGIGSLLVQDVFGDQLPLAGNLYVPVNLIKDTLPDLLRQGKRLGPAPSWLGISSQALPGGGLSVLRVTPNSPAAQSGILVGDTLLALQGQALDNLPDFYQRLRALGPAGSNLTLSIRRQGQIRQIDLVTADRNQSLTRPSSI